MSSGRTRERNTVTIIVMRSSFRIGLPLTTRSFPRSPGEACPAGEESETADGRDHAEPARAGEGEDVEAPREEDGAGEEAPAGRDRRGAGPARARPGGGDEREPVIHLVAHAHLEGGEELGR